LTKKKRHIGAIKVVVSAEATKYADSRLGGFYRVLLIIANSLGRKGIDRRISPSIMAAASEDGPFLTGAAAGGYRINYKTCHSDKLSTLWLSKRNL